MPRRLAIAASALLLALVVTPVRPASATVYGKSISDRPPIGRVSGENRDSANPDAANTYTQRDWSPAPAGTRYDRIDAQLATWNTSDTTGYFYANSFYLVNGHEYGGYIGLQTRLINCTPTCVNQGHGVVASVWNAYSVTPVAGLPVIAVSDVEVGVPFKSLHFTYNWLPGHIYRTAIIRDETLRCLHCNSWSAGIVDDSTGVYTVFGYFTMLDGQGDALMPLSVEFSEEYTPNSWPACNMPYSRTDWTQNEYLGQFNPSTGATSFVFAPTQGDSIQTGTGCTNSNSYPLGGGAHRQVISGLT